jgi:hypothetical protein
MQVNFTSNEFRGAMHYNMHACMFIVMIISQKGEHIFDQWVVYTYIKEGPQLKGVRTIAKYETSCKKKKKNTCQAMRHALVLRLEHERCSFGEHQTSLHKQVGKNVMV